MSSFLSNSNSKSNMKSLLNIYGKVMLLKICVCGPNELKEKYIDAAISHNEKVMRNQDMVDAGFDLFAPGNEDDENNK